jgi:hypothetical protein
MKPLLFNLILGIVPVLALASTIAADERKSAADRVVASDSDRRTQLSIFLLVDGLWSGSLAMWNWMRGYPLGWVVFWSVVSIVALIAAALRRRR